MSALDVIARRLLAIERRLDARNHPQLAHQSIMDGAISAYVQDRQTMVIGKQFDGSNGSYPLTGPAPPRTSVPVLSVDGSHVRVTWDGTFAEARDEYGNDYFPVAPMDFSQVDIAVSTNPNFNPLSVPPLESVTTARGGTRLLSLSAETTYYFALICWSVPGKHSPPSALASTTTGKATGDVSQEYVDQQDEITLEAAKAYTDSHSGAGFTIFEYTMPTPQTTATIDHDLGHDPASVQVIIDGHEALGYSVSFPITDTRVLVGFDLPVQATIRLI